MARSVANRSPPPMYSSPLASHAMVPSRRSRKTFGMRSADRIPSCRTMGLASPPGTIAARHVHPSTFIMAWALAGSSQRKAATTSRSLFTWRSANSRARAMTKFGVLGLGLPLASSSGAVSITAGGSTNTSSVNFPLVSSGTRSVLPSRVLSSITGSGTSGGVPPRLMM